MHTTTNLTAVAVALLPRSGAIWGSISHRRPVAIPQRSSKRSSPLPAPWYHASCLDLFLLLYPEQGNHDAVCGTGRTHTEPQCETCRLSRLDGVAVVAS